MASLNHNTLYYMENEMYYVYVLIMYIYECICMKYTAAPQARKKILGIFNCIIAIPPSIWMQFLLRKFKNPNPKIQNFPLPISENKNPPPFLEISPEEGWGFLILRGFLNWNCPDRF